MNGIFTRLRPVKLEEAGIYLTLGPSLPVPRGGNNQVCCFLVHHDLGVASRSVCASLRSAENLVSELYKQQGGVGISLRSVPLQDHFI